MQFSEKEIQRLLKHENRVNCSLKLWEYKLYTEHISQGKYGHNQHRSDTKLAVILSWQFNLSFPPFYPRLSDRVPAPGFTGDQRSRVCMCGSHDHLSHSVSDSCHPNRLVFRVGSPFFAHGNPLNQPLKVSPAPFLDTSHSFPVLIPGCWLII